MFDTLLYSVNGPRAWGMTVLEGMTEPAPNTGLYDVVSGRPKADEPTHSTPVDSSLSPISTYLIASR